MNNEEDDDQGILEPWNFELNDIFEFQTWMREDRLELVARGNEETLYAWLPDDMVESLIVWMTAYLEAKKNLKLPLGTGSDASVETMEKK
jgi:hypothetical protein